MYQDYKNSNWLKEYNRVVTDTAKGAPDQQNTERKYEQFQMYGYPFVLQVDQLKKDTRKWKQYTTPGIIGQFEIEGNTLKTLACNTYEAMSGSGIYVKVGEKK